LKVPTENKRTQEERRRANPRIALKAGLHKDADAVAACIHERQRPQDSAHALDPRGLSSRRPQHVEAWQIHQNFGGLRRHLKVSGGGLADTAARAAKTRNHFAVLCWVDIGVTKLVERRCALDAVAHVQAIPRGQRAGQANHVV
jgi:hypothetical protein